MAGLMVGGILGGVAKLREKRKGKARAAAEEAQHEERENRFVSEKERWAAEDRLNAQRNGDEGSSSATAPQALHPALASGDLGDSSAPQYPAHVDAELPTYDEVAQHGEQERPVLPPYGAPMSPATQRQFEDYLSARQAGSSQRERSPNAPKGETEEERKKRKLDEFWKFRGGGWWTMVGWSMVRLYDRGFAAT